MPTPGPDLAVVAFLGVVEASMSPHTLAAYRGDLACLAGFLGRPSAEATREELTAWLANLRDRGQAPATIRRRAATAKSFFDYLVMIGVRSDNPAAYLKRPRQSRGLPRVPSPAEARRLCEAACGNSPLALRDRALVELLYGCGLRVTEAVTLRPARVDLKNGLVRVFGKGGQERIVPLGREAARALRRYLADGRPHLEGSRQPELFLNHRGGPLTRAGAHLIVGRLAGKAGLDPAMHPHLLRHAFAVHLLEGGANLLAVQRMLGHTDPGTTEIYTRLSSTYRRGVYFASHPHARRRGREDAARDRARGKFEARVAAAIR